MTPDVVGEVASAVVIALVLLVSPLSWAILGIAVATTLLVTWVALLWGQVFATIIGKEVENE